MIVPVKKAKIFILDENKTDLLIALQKNEVIMLDSNIDNKNVDVKYEEDIIQRATTVIGRLANYHAKPGFTYYHSVDYDEFIKEDVSRIDLLEDLEKDFSLIEEKKQRNEIINEELKTLTPFHKLPYTTHDLSKSLYVSFHLGYISNENLEGLLEHFKNSNIESELFEESDYGIPLIFVLDKDEEVESLSKINSLGFIGAKLPESKTKIGNLIVELYKEVKTNQNIIDELEEKFKNGFELNEQLKVLVDQVNARKTRKLVSFNETDSTVYIEGWVREDQIDLLDSVVKSVTSEYDIDISDSNNDEVPPTATNNNKFVKQFETITNMYSVPKHNEIDPNPVMSVWYWILFGIMMGDMGYGLMMIVGLGLFIKIKKPKGSFGQLVHILYYSGYTSLIAGFIYGSMFGFEVDIIKWIGSLFDQNWHSFILMDNIMPMLILSVGIGVLHLTSGLVLKVKLALKHNDLLTALADGVSWISILLGGSFAILAMMVLKLDWLMYVGLGFVGIGLLLIITLAGREKKGAFGKVTGALGGLYGAADYLSDLLSYSRILALALSSAVIASTMNTLAELVQGNWFGIIMSVFIYVIGHVFNFVMGLLSAYVHDSRLQYIEFFGKFYEGGGYEFKPLSFDTKYIQEITN